MLFRYWLLFTGILAIMTIAARIMYRVMRYGMHKLVPETLPAYLDERGVMQVYLLLIEWFILVLLNRMRRFIITSAFTGLPLPLRNSALAGSVCYRRLVARDGPSCRHALGGIRRFSVGCDRASAHDHNGYGGYDGDCAAFL